MVSVKETGAFISKSLPRPDKRSTFDSTLTTDSLDKRSLKTDFEAGELIVAKFLRVIRLPFSIDCGALVEASWLACQHLLPL